MKRLIAFLRKLLSRKKSLSNVDLRYRWKFRDYVWPHDLMKYNISYRDTGIVVSCTGAFIGDGAYEEFKKLALVFYQPYAGVLEIPNIGTYVVHFVKLELKKQPQQDLVEYECEFYEVP